MFRVDGLQSCDSQHASEHVSFLLKVASFVLCPSPVLTARIYLQSGDGNHACRVRRHRVLSPLVPGAEQLPSC